MSGTTSDDTTTTDWHNQSCATCSAGPERCSDVLYGRVCSRWTPRQPATPDRCPTCGRPKPEGACPDCGGLRIDEGTERALAADLATTPEPSSVQGGSVDRELLEVLRQDARECEAVEICHERPCLFGPSAECHEVAALVAELIDERGSV